MVVVREGGRESRSARLKGAVGLKYGAERSESSNVFSLAETPSPLSLRGALLECKEGQLRQSLRPSALVAGSAHSVVNRVPEPSSNGPNRANCWLETRRATAGQSSAKIG